MTDCFIVDATHSPEGRALALFPNYHAAAIAHRQLEPRPSLPGGRWNYMITFAYGEDDCRGDLSAMTRRHRAQTEEAGPSPSVQLALL